MRAVNGSATTRCREWRPASATTMTTGICSLLLFLLWGQMALAQEPGEVVAPDAGLDDRHRIEIIVFRHLDQGGTTPEEATTTVPARPTDAPAAMRGRNTDPSLAPVPAAAASADTAGPWPALNPTELKLGAVATRLRQSTRYRVLYHGGWLQPLAPQDRTAPTPLPAPAHSAGLDGTITAYRDNFLHVLLDIGLHEPAAEEPGSERVYVLRQGRRLRGQSAHYFDHPQFGVILLVE